MSTINANSLSINAKILSYPEQVIRAAVLLRYHKKSAWHDVAEFFGLTPRKVRSIATGGPFDLSWSEGVRIVMLADEWQRKEAEQLRMRATTIRGGDSDLAKILARTALMVGGLADD